MWNSPSYGFADWVELHTILSSGADLPTAGQWSADHCALPMSTALATQRTLLLLFAHHVGAHQMLVPGGGRRAEVRHFIRLSRANHAKLMSGLAAVRDRMQRGPAWLDDAGDPTLWALAHWRALAVAGSWVRTRDSSLVVRVADRYQAAALHASADVIGFELRRETVDARAGTGSSSIRRPYRPSSVSSSNSGQSPPKPYWPGDQIGGADSVRRSSSEIDFLSGPRYW